MGRGHIFKKGKCWVCSCYPKLVKHTQWTLRPLYPPEKTGRSDLYKKTSKTFFFLLFSVLPEEQLRWIGGIDWFVILGNQSRPVVFSLDSKELRSWAVSGCKVLCWKVSGLLTPDPCWESRVTHAELTEPGLSAFFGTKQREDTIELQ